MQGTILELSGELHVGKSVTYIHAVWPNDLGTM